MRNIHVLSRCLREKPKRYGTVRYLWMECADDMTPLMDPLLMEQAIPLRDWCRIFS